jgi:hypothetical protein
MDRGGRERGGKGKGEGGQGQGQGQGLVQLDPRQPPGFNCSLYGEPHGFYTIRIVPTGEMFGT